jgi:CRISPR-associated protein Cas5h
MNKLLSIDLFADFGMLKKPDTNEPVYLTFNMLHKPALLGIFGAITGLSGFKEQGVFPEYFEKLKALKVGIAPLETETKKYHDSGNFTKTIIKYNNSTGLASDEAGGNLMVTEQTLVAPAYRCYLMLDSNNPDHAVLHHNLVRYKAEFLPYLGKNECALWWENATPLQYDYYAPTGPFRISSLFIKEESLKDGTRKVWFIPGITRTATSTFMYFENLPIGYADKPLYQYEYRGFAFTNLELSQDYKLPEEYPLLRLQNGQVIQVF